MAEVVALPEIVVTPSAPKLTIEEIYQIGVGFFDATYAFGTSVFPDEAQVFAVAKTITLELVVPGSIIIGALEDGSNGAAKGAITGYSAALGAEIGGAFLGALGGGVGFAVEAMQGEGVER